MRNPLRIPHHSTVAAYAALFIALGGVGYAAPKLASNSVGTAQIRNGSVTPAKLAKAAKPPTKAKIASVVQDVITDPNTGINITVKGEKGDTGPQGPQGVPGATGGEGPPGTALAWAIVNPDGQAVQAKSITVTHPRTGAYCLDVTVGPPQVISIALDGVPGFTTAHVKGPGFECPAGTNYEVFVDQSGTLVDDRFYATVN